LLPRCRIPILFVNGTNDVHYTLDSYQKSFERVPDARKQMRIQVNMPHGHTPGWAPQEIGLFVDSYCRSGKPLAVPGKVEVKEEKVTVAYESAVPLKEAVLHYTTDTGLRSKRTWKSEAAKIEGDAGKGRITAPKPPKQANTWFVSLTDERGAMVSTTVQFQPELKP
jgi:PhoPQ-activated pathogenicity-related protein